MLPPVGVVTILTVPVTGVPLQVMPEPTVCGVAVTVYAPAVEPVTVILAVVDATVSPAGRDHAYCVAPVTPAMLTDPDPAEAQ